MRHVTVGPVTIGNDLPLVFLSGPCQIESRAHALETASALAEMARVAGVPSSTNPPSTRRTAPR